MLPKIRAHVTRSLFGQPVSSSIRLRFPKQNIPAGKPEREGEGSKKYIIHQHQHYLRDEPAYRKSKDHPGNKNPPQQHRLDQSGDAPKQGYTREDKSSRLMMMPILLHGREPDKYQPCGSELAQRPRARISRNIFPGHRLTPRITSVSIQLKLGQILSFFGFGDGFFHFFFA
jgi:hypothetical protein